MIEPRTDFDALARRLADRAQRLAQSRAAEMALRDRDRRWRNALLLWPHFAQPRTGKG